MRADDRSPLTTYLIIADYDDFFPEIIVLTQFVLKYSERAHSNENFRFYSDKTATRLINN